MSAGPHSSFRHNAILPAGFSPLLAAAIGGPGKRFDGRAES